MYSDGRPALGSLPQDLHLLVGQVEAAAVDQQLARLRRK